jgi:hypothetical protein
VAAQRDGLLAFVHSCGGKEVSSARKAALAAVRHVLERAGEEAARYAVHIKQACLQIVNNVDEDNGVRAETLALLAAVTALPLPPGVVAALKLGELASNLRARLQTHDKKSPGGVRKELLRCLGALVEHFADAVAAEPLLNAARVPDADVPLPIWLRRRALRELESMLSGATKRENVVVEGAVDALSAALAPLPPGTLPAKEAADAFRWLLFLLDEEDAARYGCVLRRVLGLPRCTPDVSPLASQRQAGSAAAACASLCEPLWRTAAAGRQRHARRAPRVQAAQEQRRACALRAACGRS